MFLAAFRPAVAPLLAELEASANAHDTDRHMAAYARVPTLTFVFNGGIVRGWDTLREMQRTWWSDGKAGGSYAYVGEPIFEVLEDDAGLTTFLILARKEAVAACVCPSCLSCRVEPAARLPWTVIGGSR